MAKFVFVSTLEAFPWGGSEELWSRAAEYLAREGNEVACCVSPAQGAHPRIQSLVELGCKVEIRSPVFSLRDRLWSRLLPERHRKLTSSVFERFLEKYRPDLTVISQGGNLCLNPYAFECKTLQVPYVTIVQSVPEARFVPDDSNFRQLGSAYENALQVFFVSDSNRVVLERQLSRSLANSSRCYNPFNLVDLSAVAWPSEISPLRLACVARMEFYAKGQDLLIDVLSRSNWTGRNLKVNFFGSGPNKQLLTDLIEKRQLRARAEVAGFEPDVRKIWRDHHALILPSRQEGLPLSLVEAAMCGRPAVVTNIGGNAEVTVEGITGYVASSPTAAALDSALERMWSSRECLVSVGEAARARVLEVIPKDPVQHFVESLKSVLVRK